MIILDKFNIRKLEGYTIMSNHHLRDPNLSYSAKGLLSFMLALPDKWDYSFSGLVKISKEGKSSIRTMINELKEAKYIKISQSRNEKGFFQYNYDVFEIPFDMPIKTANYPTPENRTSDNRNTENQPQINTNKKIDIYDNIDKTKIPEHHYLTKELFKLNYISDMDSSSFLFDDLFNNYLSNGFTFGNIISSIHYIVPRVVNRKFIDEDGKEIKNKYGYFKNAFESNISKFNNMPDELYPEKNDDYEL